MSYQATSWAKRQSTKAIEPRGHACKLLLMVLADYVNHETGVASVTIGELSKHCQVDKATTHRNLRKLEKIGLIIRQKKTSLYRTPGFMMSYRNQSPIRGQNIGKHGAATPKDKEESENAFRSVSLWERSPFTRTRTPVPTL